MRSMCYMMWSPSPAPQLEPRFLEPATTGLKPARAREHDIPPARADGVQFAPRIPAFAPSRTLAALSLVINNGPVRIEVLAGSKPNLAYWNAIVAA
jgi:hypothetical protein